MNLNKVVSPLGTLAFRTWRSLTVFVPGGRIRAFGGGTGQIAAIMVVNLDRQPRRWRRVTRELRRFRTSEGVPLMSIARRLAAVDARDGRAVAATVDVDAMYRIADHLYVQPDARLAECFAEDEPVRMTRQEVAVARSHVEAWKAVATGTDDYVLVLETTSGSHPAPQPLSIAAGVPPWAGTQSKVARGCSTFRTPMPAERRCATMFATSSFGLRAACGSSRVTCSRARERPRSFAQCPSSAPSTSG